MQCGHFIISPLVLFAHYFALVPRRLCECFFERGEDAFENPLADVTAEGQFAATFGTQYQVSFHGFHSNRFRYMFIFVFLNEHAENFHERGKRMFFVFTHGVHQPVKESYELAVFTFIAWNAQRRLDLRPSFKSFFHLGGGHNH